MTSDQIIPIPAIGYTHPLGEGTLGLGFFGTQGNRTEYPRPHTTSSHIGNGDRRSELAVVKLPISYAHPVGRGWSLGGTFMPVYGRFRTDSVTLKLRPADGDDAWDDALGIGFQLAAHKDWERWSFGAVYSSRIWMQDYKKYSVDLLPFSMDLPQKFQTGIAFRPTDRVELLLDYKWVDWTGVELFGNKTVANGLAWRDSHIVKAGVNWNINDRWSVRGGASYGKAPVREDAAFANGITAALAQWNLALGATYRINERHEIHASLSHVPREEIADNGQGDLFSFLGRGTRISYQENSFTVQYSMKF